MITDPEKSWEEFDRMIGNAEKFHQLLNLPYRVVNIVSGRIACSDRSRDNERLSS